MSGRYGVKTALLGMLISMVSYSATSFAEGAENETVVLLHGLARSAQSMETLARRIEKAGFHTVNLDYPSTKDDMQSLAANLRSQLQQCCELGRTKLNFVTHSMGGILVRYYAAQYGSDDIHRVVMISPPNQGSELVDKLGDLALFRWVNGPAGNQLGTDPDSTPHSLGPAPFTLGIITGNRTLNPLYSSMIDGEDDGKVAVESAKMEKMTDFLVLPHSHTFIMNSEEVARQAIHFLRKGEFSHPQAKTEVRRRFLAAES